MNISKVCINLEGKDILSIINDFVHVKGLTLNEVIINNEVLIRGSFVKGIKINFEVAIDNLGVEDGKIVGKFSKFKVYKLGIFKIFRSLTLKTFLKVIGDIGIEANEDRLKVDLDKTLENVPFIKLMVEEAYIKENTIVANVCNISINVGKILDETKKEKVTEKVNKKEEAYEEAFELRESAIKEKEEYIDSEAQELIKEAETIEIEEALKDTNKKEDYYSKGRETTKEKLEKRLSENTKQYSDYVFFIPDLVALIFRLLKDDRVPLKTKLAVSGSVAYIVCPTNIIPNNIPFIGRIDDLAVLFFALNRIANDVPLKVIVENWSGKNELLLVLKTGVNYISDFTCAANVEKIYSIVEQLSTL